MPPKKSKSKSAEQSMEATESFKLEEQSEGTSMSKAVSSMRAKQETAKDHQEILDAIAELKCMIQKLLDDKEDEQEESEKSASKSKSASKTKSASKSKSVKEESSGGLWASKSTRKRS